MMWKDMVGRESGCMVGGKGGCVVGRGEGMGSMVILTFFFCWLTHKSFGVHLNLIFYAFLGAIRFYLPSKP